MKKKIKIITMGFLMIFLSISCASKKKAGCDAYSQNTLKTTIHRK